MAAQPGKGFSRPHPRTLHSTQSFDSASLSSAPDSTPGKNLFRTFSFQQKRQRDNTATKLSRAGSPLNPHHSDQTELSLTDDPTTLGASSVRLSSYSVLNSESAWSSCPIPVGMIFSPFVSLNPAPPRLRRPPTRCENCAAFVNPYCKLDDSGGWRCCFCRSKNPCISPELLPAARARTAGGDGSVFEMFPELARKAVEYSDTIHTAGGPLSPACPPSLILLLDASLDAAALTALHTALQRTLPALPQDTMVGLIVFSQVVSIYEVGLHGVASADVFPGSQSPQPASLQAILQHERCPPAAGAEYMAPLHFCASSLLATIVALAQARADGSGHTSVAASASAAFHTTAAAAAVAAAGMIDEAATTAVASAAAAATAAAAASGGGDTSGSGSGSGGSGGKKLSARRLRLRQRAAERKRKQQQQQQQQSGEGEVKSPDTQGSSSGSANATSGGSGSGSGISGAAAVTGRSPAAAAAAGASAGLLSLLTRRDGEATAAASARRRFDRGAACAGRATGAAVEYAMALLQTCQTSKHGRILLLTAGVPDTGPGSMAAVAAAAQRQRGRAVGHTAVQSGLEVHAATAEAYFSALGTDVLRCGAVVDVVAGGHTSFAAPAMLALTRGNGGTVSILKDMSQELPDNIFVCLRRASAHPLALSLRLSDPLRVTQFIGAVSEPQLTLSRASPAAARRAASAAAHGASATAASLLAMGLDVGGDSSQATVSDAGAVYRLEAGSADPASALTVLLATEDDIPEDNVYVQWAVQLPCASGHSVTRVITRKIATTGSPNHFLKTVDASVTSLLCAKQLVLHAHSAPGADATLLPASTHSLLDARVKDVAIYMGQHLVAGDMPAAVAALPPNLFHLRRGILLGPLLQHADDIACTRALFLRLGVEAASRMAFPRLLAIRDPPTDVDASSVIQMQEFPATTLSLLSDCVLLLDCQTEVIVWSGSRLLPPPAYDIIRAAFREFSLETFANYPMLPPPDQAQAAFESGSGNGAAFASVHRYPVPPVTFVAEGSSLSRAMRSRLAPGHNDPPAVQETQFPLLKQLPADELAAHRAKLMRTDDRSFQQYYAALFRHMLGKPGGLNSRAVYVAES